MTVKEIKTYLDTLDENLEILLVDLSDDSSDNDEMLTLEHLSVVETQEEFTQEEGKALAITFNHNKL